MKQPLYFNLSLSSQQYDLAVEALADALLQQGSMKGEIGFQDYPSVKVKYDLSTGKISLAPAEGESPYVKTVFSAKSFPFIVAPVRDAITLCAQRQLLNELKLLGEDAINAVIAKYGVRGKDASFSRLVVNKILIHLQSRKRLSLIASIWGNHSDGTSEIDLLLANTLKQFGIENVTSQDKVDEFMQGLQEKKSKKKKGAIDCPSKE